jgi:methyl-accepting chemotaxis protein
VDTICSNSAGIAAAVEEQSVMVGEIAQSMTLATGRTRDVQENIRSVSSLAGSAESTAKDVLGAARSLSQQAEMLDREVGSFIAEISGSVEGRLDKAA